jgi:hypothetical protein
MREIAMCVDLYTFICYPTCGSLSKKGRFIIWEAESKKLSSQLEDLY